MIKLFETNDSDRSLSVTDVLCLRIFRVIRLVLQIEDFLFPLNNSARRSDEISLVKRISLTNSSSSGLFAKQKSTVLAVQSEGVAIHNSAGDFPEKMI